MTHMFDQMFACEKEIVLRDNNVLIKKFDAAGSGRGSCIVQTL